MTLSNPQRWRLRIRPDGYELLEHRTFSGYSSSRLPKIYVFSDGNVPVYVGIAKRPISQRLRYGFAAAGKHGYHGYALRRPEAIREYGGELSLTIWVQSDPVPEMKGGKPIQNADGSLRWSLEDMKKVEAEVVYLIRHRTGEWPRYQTEIHFSAPETAHRKAAGSVLTHLFIEESASLAL